MRYLLAALPERVTTAETVIGIVFACSIIFSIGALLAFLWVLTQLEVGQMAAAMRYKCPVCGQEYDPAKFPRPEHAKVMTPVHFLAGSATKQTCNGSGRTPNVETDAPAEWPGKSTVVRGESDFFAPPGDVSPEHVDTVHKLSERMDDQ